ncbi:MAG: formimidoylglutamase [Bacteroidetes bacterium]|nr:formimidoylglutamase [Bacteroidota bacterium]
MEILDFFEPLDIASFEPENGFDEGTWSKAIASHTTDKIPDLRFKKIALIGLVSPNDKIQEAAQIRKHLYALKRAEFAEEIIDLGNFKFDYKLKTYQSLGYVLSELMNAGIVPVILNGRQDVTYSQYLAFSYIKSYANLTSFDAHLDFNMHENPELTEKNYLQKILLEEPSFLFHFSQVGYQLHFADTQIINFLEKLYFDMIRLGDAKANLADIEPVLRNTHFVSWDISAIRQADAPGTNKPSPNGFYAEDACALARYAGASTHVKNIGFYEFNPANDLNGQTAHLIAQMVWYFTDGFLNRYNENPIDNRDEFLKFITSLQDNNYQIVFYKSKRTDRWWMEVPINEKEFDNSTHIIPCSYNDYVAATKEQIPDRWWQAMKKLS